MKNEIKIVIGSWGSYNECNERALGSEWLTRNDYDSWDEIAEELKKQGFVLNGIDEELFVQDVEGIPSSSTNWDYVHPKDLFETLKESGILVDNGKYDTFLAFSEVRDFSEFEERVRDRGGCWDDDIYIYRGYNWDDYGREMFSNCDYRIEEHLLDFFDFEAYGKYIGDCTEEYSGGLIEIYR